MKNLFRTLTLAAVLCFCAGSYSALCSAAAANDQPPRDDRPCWSDDQDRPGYCPGPREGGCHGGRGYGYHHRGNNDD